MTTSPASLQVVVTPQVLMMPAAAMRKLSAFTMRGFLEALL